MTAWHWFKPLKQYTYREYLNEFSASSWSGSGYGKVGEWEREMYLNRGVLREVWVKLERRGEAGEWVRGVGEGYREGEEGKEWVEVSRKMLRSNSSSYSMLFIEPIQAPELWFQFKTVVDWVLIMMGSAGVYEGY
ncbi:hypothetical protein L208DRAFT_1486719 [Tricholoma matsutake]|nr:hypothetical protein L208DRAFT_1486719 [Tricholoma matsutake 945]